MSLQLNLQFDSEVVKFLNSWDDLYNKLLNVYEEHFYQTYKIYYELIKGLISKFNNDEISIEKCEKSVHIFNQQVFRLDCIKCDFINLCIASTQGDNNKEKKMQEEVKEMNRIVLELGEKIIQKKQQLRAIQEEKERKIQEELILKNAEELEVILRLEDAQYGKKLNQKQKSKPKQASQQFRSISPAAGGAAGAGQQEDTIRVESRASTTSESLDDCPGCVSMGNSHTLECINRSSSPASSTSPGSRSSDSRISRGSTIDDEDNEGEKKADCEDERDSARKSPSLNKQTKLSHDEERSINYFLEKVILKTENALFKNLKSCIQKYYSIGSWASGWYKNSSVHVYDGPVKKFFESIDMCTSSHLDRKEIEEARNAARGFAFELVAAESLQTCVKYFSLVVDRKEFDIATKDTLYECKNINWQHNGDEMKKQFVEQRDIAWKKGYKYYVYSAWHIPVEWQKWFASQGISYRDLQTIVGDGNAPASASSKSSQ
ncbi:MAG: hypothetical protein NTX86_01595 [Candidatus Dependentiae bacterium]|nr:hypothetical protein [Candidatus Dependentiae bacterium]